MASKLGRMRWEPVPGKPNYFKAIAEVTPITGKDELGKPQSIVIEVNTLNSNYKNELKAKLRNEATRMQGAEELKNVLEVVKEELKAEYPDEFK